MGTIFYVADEILMRWTKNLKNHIEMARVLSSIKSKFTLSINDHSDIREVFEELHG